MSRVANAAPLGAGAAALACPEYPPSIESLLGVLRHQREHLAAHVVCHRLRRERRGFTADGLTVDALIERAGRAAAHLQRAGVRQGDRVIVSLSDPHDFLAAFFGAGLLGASAVPLPTVAEAGAPRSFAARVRAVSHDCAPSAAVVESVERFAAVAGAPATGLRVFEPRDLAQDAVAVELRDLPASLPAFIQYTSGSTGAPKGVVVTHGNIMTNCRAIRDATAYTRGDRMVSWLPLHHDMGLVGGLLTSIYCAAETFLMPPTTFLARPVAWLEAITRFAGTLTVAPTFAYSLCARKVPDTQLAGVDLSSLRLAYIGAEPIDADTLEAFIARFAAYGLSRTAMYPVYGLAEATLAVGFPRPGAPLRYDTVDRRRLAADGVAVPSPANADSVTVVSVGHPLPGHRVRIVDRESGEALGERQVGELVAEGGSITPRYFADGDGAVRAALHTGDLAYLAEGHLYVVDRIKDLVVIGGQNYAPSDIENAAAQVGGLRRGRIVAFSTPGRLGTEELHIVAEVRPTSWRSPRELEDALRRRVLADIGLAAATVTVVAPGTLERTSSGKLKRRACAAAHRRGALANWRRRDRLLYRIVRRVQTMTGAVRALLRRRTERL